MVLNIDNDTMNMKAFSFSDIISLNFLRAVNFQIDPSHA
jgi:hypothetical protein